MQPPEQIPQWRLEGAIAVRAAEAPGLAEILQVDLEAEIARTLGNCLSMNSYSLLVHHLGPGRTLDMLLRARLLSADDAHAAGFVGEVVPDGELDPALASLVETLLGHAPLSMKAAGQAVARLRRANLPDGDDLVREVVDDLFLRTYARPGAPEPDIPHDQLLELGRRAVGSDRSAELWPVAADGVAARRRGAAQGVRTEVEARKRRLGLVDYDDWLVLLRDALADPVHGAAACERVRARYRVVLVDEFQDSDPVQWEVLRLAHDDDQGPTSDDLLALADAVREAAQPRPVEVPVHAERPLEGTRRGHLRALRSED